MNRLCCLLLILSVAGTSCQDKAEKQLKAPIAERVEWLLGSWTIRENASLIEEVWSEESDECLRAYTTFKDTNGKVLFSEEIRLIDSGSSYWYLPVVSNQNAGEAVYFKEVRFSDTMITFENIAHDFPQRIVYQKLSDSVIHAYIAGTKNGALSADTFKFRRKKI